MQLTGRGRGSRGGGRSPSTTNKIIRMNHDSQSTTIDGKKIKQEKIDAALSIMETKSKDDETDLYEEPPKSDMKNGWDDLEYLMKLSQMYAIAKARDGDDEVNNSMIAVCNDRIRELMEITKNEGPNYERVEVASILAMEQTEEWDDLSFVYQTEVDLMQQWVRESNEEKKVENDALSLSGRFPYKNWRNKL